MSDNNNNNNNDGDVERVEWGSTPETEDEPEKMLSAKEMNQLNLADPMEYLYQGDVEIERNGHSEGYVTVKSKSFEELDLSPELLQAVQKMNYKLASTIQTISIPEITAQPIKHFLGQSKSGTGKTAAFTIPLLMRVDKNLKLPQGICVCPTRELAIQNFEIIKQLSEFTGISVGLLIPEVTPEVSNIPAKVKKITNQIIICTPGIAMGFVSKGILDLKKILMFVLDEADEMLNEESLQAQTLRIYKAINPRAQIVCFSATFNKTVLAFIDKFYPKDQQKVKVTLRKDDVVVKSIFQAVVKVPKTKKIDIRPNDISINLNFVHNFAQAAGARINAIRGPNRDDLINKERRKIREEFKTTYGAQLNAEFERIRQALGLKSPNHFTRIDPNTFANVRGAKDLLRIFSDYRELIYAAYPDISFHWNNKEKLLLKLYEIINIGQTIAFANERNTAKNLAQVMLRDGANVGVLTREEVNNQHLRDVTLQGFRNNDFQFLIATNVLARGINVSAVTLVVNFDIPTKGRTKDVPDYETYIHRIGRTGRWGQTGIALNIITEDDNTASKLLFDIACEYDIQMKNIALVRDNNTGKVRQIFVDNLPATATIEDLKNHFGQFGKIESADLVNLLNDAANKIVGCVTFENSQAAGAAVQGANERPFPPSSEVITVRKDKFDFALYQLYSESLRKPDVAAISAQVEKISIQ